jgi:hypothetical protein
LKDTAIQEHEPDIKHASIDRIHFQLNNKLQVALLNLRDLIELSTDPWQLPQIKNKRIIGQVGGLSVPVFQNILIVLRLN